jgi:hypothetical protein
MECRYEEGEREGERENINSQKRDRESCPDSLFASEWMRSMTSPSRFLSLFLSSLSFSLLSLSLSLLSHALMTEANVILCGTSLPDSPQSAVTLRHSKVITDSRSHHFLILLTYLRGLSNILPFIFLFLFLSPLLSPHSLLPPLHSLKDSSFDPMYPLYVVIDQAYGEESDGLNTLTDQVRKGTS